MGKELQLRTEYSREVFVNERYVQKEHVSWEEGSMALEEQNSEMQYHAVW